MFILHAVVQKYLNENNRLYCAFVDFKKAFDSIYRNGLWLKLYRSGIDGKLLQIIRDMYNKVKSCVKTCNNYSEFFEYAIGLRQGEIMSPIMFSLYLEDLELFLQDDITCGLKIDDIVLILLLFADDMVILGDSPVELQNSLNLLYSYCNKWSLEVNAQKTQVMVFRKRGKLLQNECFSYNGSQLEVVNDFNYLGTVFNYTGTFALNQERLVGKALKALNVLIINIKKIKVKPKIACQLFDAFVGSILNYSSEIWGYGKSKEIERIHLKFCKAVLNVRTNTSNAGIYGELGRYPMYVNRFVRILKYWFKLLNTDNVLLKAAYQLSFECCLADKKGWLTNIKQLLSQYGFAYVWDQQGVPNEKAFINVFKQRLIDTFYQAWYSDLDKSEVLLTYKLVKNEFGYEKYLDYLQFDLRSYLVKLRLSSHNLHIQTGRFGRNRIPRSERYCMYCRTRDIEDEYHFIIICPCFEQIRKKFIKRHHYEHPSMFKFLNLLKSDDNDIITNLAKYLKAAFTLRISLTHNM